MMLQKTFMMAMAICVSLLLPSCKNQSDVISYDYHAHVMQPSAADKSLGDVLFIDVEFESHTGENVEHINVKIFDAASSVVVYSKPVDPHIPFEVSTYEFTDQVTLSTANGFFSGDWVIETSVWGEHEGQDAEVEQVEFHINP